MAIAIMSKFLHLALGVENNRGVRLVRQILRYAQDDKWGIRVTNGDQGDKRGSG